MRRLGFFSMLFFLALPGCGSKSALLDPSVNGPGESPPEDPVDPIDPVDPVDPKPQGPCGQALLKDAVAPMWGYCPTRAFRSLFAGPTKPATVVTTPLETMFIEPIVLDEGGRAYAAVDAHDKDSNILLDMLVAVDPDGSVAWSKKYEGHLAFAPLLLAGGGVLIVVRLWSDDARHLVTLDSSGAEIADVVVPPYRIWELSVLPDGAFAFVEHDVESDWSRVVVLETDGAIRFVTDPAPGTLGALAVSNDGTIVVTQSTHLGGDTRITALSPEGKAAWTLSVTGAIAGGPAIGVDGAVHLATSSPGGEESVLAHAIEADGEPRYSVPIGTQGGAFYHPLVVGPDGESFVRIQDEVVALEPDGAERWRRDVHMNLAYGATLDTEQTLWITSGTITRVDPETGEDLLVIEPPDPSSCTSPAVIGDRSLVFGQCNGDLVRME